MPATSLAIYFIFSVTGSLLFLYGCSGSSYGTQILLLSLLLKIGLAPFQFWVFSVLPFLAPLQLCFFLGPAKAGLLYLTLSLNCVPYLFFLATTLVGLVTLFIASSLFLVLYSSGSVQLIILVLLGSPSFFVFWLTYLVALFCVALVSFELCSPLFAFSCLAGLPPLPFFWGKLFGLGFLAPTSAFLLLLLSGLSFFPYFRFALGCGSASSTSLPLLALLSASSALVTML